MLEKKKKEDRPFVRAYAIYDRVNEQLYETLFNSLEDAKKECETDMEEHSYDSEQLVVCEVIPILLPHRDAITWKELKR